LRFQTGVSPSDSIQDSWIVWRTQPEPNQRQCVRADHVRSALKTFARRPILNRHKAVCWRGGAVALRRRNADVISVNSDLSRQVAIRGISPSLNIFVPGIGEVAQ